MKKSFEAPELTIVSFVDDDVIFTSGPGNSFGGLPGDDFIDDEDQSQGIIERSIIK